MKLAARIVACVATVLCALAMVEPASALAGWSGQTSGTNQHLYGVACVATTRCFAVGAGGTILMWAGSSWSAEASGVSDTIHGVACPSHSRCAAVGSHGLLLLYDGSRWFKQANLAITKDLERVACPTSQLCFAVGAEGTIVRYDIAHGVSTVQTSGTSDHLYAVSCASPSSCIAVGDQGTVTRWNGTGWSVQPTPTSSALFGVACPATSFCLAVGAKGTVLAYDGSGWRAQTTPATNDVHDVACASVSRCYAVDEKGTALIDRGGTWSAESTGASNDLRRIACPSTALCFAVGLSGTIVRYDGPTWSLQTSGTSEPLTSVSCPSVQLCFASSPQNVLLRWDGERWTVAGTSFFSRGVSCPTTISCFAVGDNEVRHYDGTGWTSTILPPTANLPTISLVDVACAGPSHCIAVGDHNAIFIYNGSSWSMYDGSLASQYSLTAAACRDTSACFAIAHSSDGYAIEDVPAGPLGHVPAPTPLNDVACASGGSPCFAVGDTIEYYTDGNWQYARYFFSVPSILPALLGVACADQSSCFAVGSGGTIMHFDGTAWAKIDSPTTEALVDVSCGSPRACMAVGLDGTTAAYAPAPATPHINLPGDGAFVMSPVTFSGSAENGTTVRVFLEGSTSPLCSAQVSAGKWSCSSSALPSGSHGIVAVASNTTGSAPSSPEVITVH